MTGNVVELNNPAFAYGRDRLSIYGAYPVAYDSSQNLYPNGPEPSIRGRTLYIPLNIWFTLASKMAFPLVSLQYQELNIDIELRPINELFVIKNDKGFYVQPNFSSIYEQFYLFLQPPPQYLHGVHPSGYTDTRTNWNSDIHLLSTYAFLSNEEVRNFAALPQQYLIKQSFTTEFHNVTGSKRVEVKGAGGMVSSWMWYFQRTDANIRNEWSNYTNWEYKSVLPSHGTYATLPSFHLDNSYNYWQTSPGYNLLSNKLFISGPYTPNNTEDIMDTWGLLFNGKYRETTQKSGVFSMVEKYITSNGCSPKGLYCYNFCLNTDPFDFQPSGAINLSKFNKIEFEFTTATPPLNSQTQTYTICDNSGTMIGINKSEWDIYTYNYNLTVMEERYNILTIESGNGSLMFAR
tara:strand:- start:28 stop:1242 length:1215 start_codon:yes stop_codon:yes gene_type:complete